MGMKDRSGTGRAWWGWSVAWVALLCAMLGLAWGSRPHWPLDWQMRVHLLKVGVSADHKVRITMPDGVRLAASLYRPRGAEGPLPTIYVRLPYGRRHYTEALRTADFARHGYAVVVQDVRGKFDSGGRFATWEKATSDGVATLDWIVKQPWSNGKVGTYGCSALGELQYTLARAHHPAHRAMIASGAGGGIGSAMGGLDAFGWYEGGVFQLSGAFGWFQRFGMPDPRTQASTGIHHALALRHLPMVDALRQVQAGPNGFAEFASMPLDDRIKAARFDYVAEGETLSVPALVINSWADPTLQGTLSLAALNQVGSGREALPEQHVILAPGNHCEHEALKSSAWFGEVPIEGADQPYIEWALRFFDQRLKGEGPGLRGLPAYLYYVVGEHRWRSAQQWPPEGARSQRWYLGSGGQANSLRGDGRLAQEPSAREQHDQFRYDPSDPVPSRGGPLCCTGNPKDLPGLVNQRDVEARQDVLVYTSAPLARPLRIAGPLSARVVLSSSALDTDLVARLTHVRADGRSTNVQEGALRLRYRNGLERKELMKPGQRYEVTVSMRSMAYLLPAGDRLRLHLTSSSFPRLERNLNTGGRNFDESEAVVAVNTVHHGGAHDSHLELSVLDLPGDAKNLARFTSLGAPHAVSAPPPQPGH